LAPSYEVTYVLSRALLRRAALQWLWRQFGLMLAGIFLVFCACLYGAVVAEDGREVVAFVAGGCFCFLFLVASSAFRWSGIPRIGRLSLRFGDEGLGMTAEQGESLTRWPAFRKLIRSKDFMFVVRRGGSTVVIPRSQLSEEALAFLRRQVSGGAD
jgi:hypothetical protein